MPEWAWPPEGLPVSCRNVVENCWGRCGEGFVDSCFFEDGQIVYIFIFVLAKRQFTHIHLQIACCKMLCGRRSSEIGENTTQVLLSLKASLFEEEIYSVEVWHPSKMLRLQ